MKSKKKLLLIGTLPPPFSGQTLSFKMLLNELSLIYETKFINISPKIDLNSKFYNLTRVFNFILHTLNLIYLALINKFHFSYLTISQSRKGFFRDFLIIFILSFFRIKIIVHLKGGNYDNFYFNQNYFIRKMIVYMLLKTHKIIVLGDALKHIFKFDLRLENKINVINNCLTFELPKKIIKSNKKTKKKINILFLSNLIESKGYNDLLEALRLLKIEGIEFQASFCGKFYLSPDDTKKYEVGELRKSFFKKIDEFNLSKNIKYISDLSFDQKIEELSLSDIFILPTNYIYEGQPVSIIEALAFENIVIATKYRSIPDMIAENVEGFFVNYGDSKDIFNKIKWIYNNETYAKIMQINAHQRYLKQFTIDKHIKKFRALIEN